MKTAICFLFILCIFGCRSQSKSGAEADKTVSEEPPPTPSKRATFLQPTQIPLDFKKYYSMHSSMHILISGQVQGVGFRYATLRMARSLQLGGWVRNLDDGRVEIIAEGSPSDLEQLVEWCHQGPSFAKVDSVQARPAANQGFSDFAIR